MRFTLKKPCKNCPFSKNKEAVKLCKQRAEEIVESLREGVFACHKSVYNSKGNSVKREKHIACAGALGYMKKKSINNIPLSLASALGWVDMQEIETSNVIDEPKEMFI